MVARKVRIVHIILILNKLGKYYKILNDTYIKYYVLLPLYDL